MRIWHPCRFGGGGIKPANNLVVTEEGFALDARQGKVLNEKITMVNTNLLKMIQVSGVITGDDDWNTIKRTGVYKIQNCNMTAANHAPVGMYQYGILVVLVAEIAGERRVKQIYYPNMSNVNNGIMATRVYNNLSNADYAAIHWNSWYAVSGTLLE